MSSHGKFIVAVLVGIVLIGAFTTIRGTISDASAIVGGMKQQMREFDKAAAGAYDDPLFKDVSLVRDLGIVK